MQKWGLKPEGAWIEAHPAETTGNFIDVDGGFHIRRL